MRIYRFKYVLTFVLLLIMRLASASYVLIPMSAEEQSDHLKAYGIVYWVISKGQKAKWLLNYRGGTFLIDDVEDNKKECRIRGVSFEEVTDAEVSVLLKEMSSPSMNQAEVLLEKAPKIAVYSPSDKLPWDDAVTLALTYAEIPYTVIYDEEILGDALLLYDWLHLHHEDFTGQYGKFYATYRSTPWYIDNKVKAEKFATRMGYNKVSKEKLAVAVKVKNFVIGGGFMFAMCSATDSFDIALSAHNTDICEAMFDGDPSTPNYQSQLDYNNTLAFRDFILDRDPSNYEFSNIDMTGKRLKITQDEDYFELMEYSAKWDPVPTMLCQNHTTLIKGFMGQTTSFNINTIKPTVLVMGRGKVNGEAKYIHGVNGKGFFTFYGGHDPEDYKHYVGDPKTELELHPNSPGYRLILNNILFPAAKKRHRKT